MMKASQRPPARALTNGEIEMARGVFKDAIHYSKVRIHRRGFLPFNWQRDGMAMAPNGNIYFKPADYIEDFSVAPPAQQAWFIHELTHVWQHQLGYGVFTRGALRVGLNYRYTLRPGKKLSDYNMEAQGDIIADYFAICILKNRMAVRNKAARDNPERFPLSLYEDVLGDFIADPCKTSHLP